MKYVKIGDIAELIRGVSYKKSDASNANCDKSTAILRANNIVNGSFELSELVYVPKELVKEEQYINKNDIMITMSSGSKAHVGKVAIAVSDMNYAFGAFCGKIVVKKDVVPKFLYYLLINGRFRSHIEKQCKGTNINNLKKDYILNYEFDLPSIHNQHRIVTRIEELFSQLDSGVETLKKTKEQLKVYRQAVLKEAFESASSSNSKNLTINDLLTKKKKGMTTGPFGTMLKKHEHQSSGVPVLGIENIGKDGFVDGNKIFVSEEKAKELSAFKVDTDDLIISRSGTVGEICIVPPHMKNALLSTNLMRISLDFDVIRADYFMYLFKSKGVVIDQVKELCKGSTRMFLNQTILKQIIFPVPTLKIQAKIIETIESRLSVCDSIEKTIDTALQEAEALRQSILKQAFEGGL